LLKLASSAVSISFCKEAKEPENVGPIMSMRDLGDDVRAFARFTISSARLNCSL